MDVVQAVFYNRFMFRYLILEHSNVICQVDLTCVPNMFLYRMGMSFDSDI